MEVMTFSRGPRSVRLAVLLLPLLLLGLGVPQGVRAHEGASSPMFEDAPIVLAPYWNNPSIVVDGKVESGEYGSYGMWTDAMSGFTMDLLHDNDSLFVALTNLVPGWMVLGFSTDLDRGMGFVAVGRVNNTLTAVNLFATSVSEELTFSPPNPSGASAIEASNVTQQGSEITAEFKVALNSTLWAFEPGEIVPTILAFSNTVATMPSSASVSEVHPLRMYALRPQDDPVAIQKLFMADISPLPGLLAVAVMGMGVTAILVTFVRRKGSK